jgi:hypothetical protein
MSRNAVSAAISQASRTADPVWWAVSARDDPGAYRDALAHLGLTQVAAARLFGIDDRTSLLGAKWCQWDSSDLAQVVSSARDEVRRQFMTDRPQAAGLVAEFLRDALPARHP